MNYEAFYTMGWPATMALLGTLVAVLGFGLAVLKFHYDVKNNNKPTNLDEDHKNKVIKHTQDILSISHRLDILNKELNHLKESVGTADSHTLSKIDEMKQQIDKLGDILIRLIEDGRSR